MLWQLIDWLFSSFELLTLSTLIGLSCVSFSSSSDDNRSIVSTNGLLSVAEVEPSINFCEIINDEIQN